MKKVLLLCETFAPEAEVIAEGNTVIYLDGVFMEGDIANNNKRMYPGSLLKREADKFQGMIESNRAVGELDHPQNLSINLERVSHRVETLGKRPGTSQWVGRIKLMETPMGRIAAEIVKAGTKLAISSRGVGSLKEDKNFNVVDEDYSLITYDIVHSPGAPNAFLGTNESREYVFENGNYFPITKSLPEYEHVEDHNIENYANEIIRFIKRLRTK